ncbi:hypothetical protein HNQ72_004576 [Rhizobium wenxiniae]|uniref:Uncharacterized protein n=1 Tax=Rhizobium wenxiniae TaxID=1737357 RepID=A0A7W9Y9Z7_9HYPH|nr:hypothetical protein [Rhizobium wenxiniae]
MNVRENRKAAVNVGEPEACWPKLQGPRTSAPSATIFTFIHLQYSSSKPFEGDLLRNFRFLITFGRCELSIHWRPLMGRGILLWLLGIPLPIVILLVLFMR